MKQKSKKSNTQNKKYNLYLVEDGGDTSLDTSNTFHILKATSVEDAIDKFRQEIEGEDYADDDCQYVVSMVSEPVAYSFKKERVIKPLNETKNKKGFAVYDDDEEPDVDNDDETVDATFDVAWPYWCTSGGHKIAKLIHDECCENGDCSVDRAVDLIDCVNDVEVCTFWYRSVTSRSDKERLQEYVRVARNAGYVSVSWDRSEQKFVSTF